MYWFVFQARFNVEKSGGKLNIAQEYLNYFIYYFIFLLAFLIIMAIPISNEYKVSKSVSPEELKKDIEVLNLGSAVVNTNYSLSFYDGKYNFRQTNFLNNYYYDSYGENYDESLQDNIIYVSENDLYKIIDNYKLAYNKYTQRKITESAKTIIENNFNGLLSDFNDFKYWEYGNQVDTKLYRIKRLQDKSWVKVMFAKEGLYIVGAMIALLALLVWIFKQIHWRYYIFGSIALAVTPILVGIIALIIFEIFDIDEWFAFLLVILAYIIVGIIVFTGVVSDKKSPLAIVSAMYLQLFLPMLPLFVFSLIRSKDLYLYNPDYDFLFDFIYWSGWLIGLMSIGLFKLMYKRMSLLPSKK